MLLGRALLPAPPLPAAGPVRPRRAPERPRSRRARGAGHPQRRQARPGPVPRYKVGKGLTVEQAHELLDAAKGRRLYALYVVAATLGLRHGELLGLRWQDLDIERATAHHRPDRPAGRRPALHRRGQDRGLRGDDPAAQGHPTGAAEAPRAAGAGTRDRRRGLAGPRPRVRLDHRHARSSPATWTGTSRRSASRPASPASGSTTFVTRSSACSWSSGRRPTSSRPSPGTPTST